jgi:hypothetical protein
MRYVMTLAHICCSRPLLLLQQQQLLLLLVAAAGGLLSHLLLSLSCSLRSLKSSLRMLW